MRVEKRIPFITRPCRRLPPKITNPLPKTVGPVIKTKDGCLFQDLRAKAVAPPNSKQFMPPLLPNPVGRIVNARELLKMRELRSSNPKRWTITALAGMFNLHRSFIIKHVLTEAEQRRAEEELIEHIDGLKFTEKRGWLMRYKIREHRRDLW